MAAFSSYTPDPDTEERVAFSKRYPLSMRDFVKLIVRHEQRLALLHRERASTAKKRDLYAAGGNATLVQAETKTLARVEAEIAAARAAFATVCECNTSLARRIRIDWHEEH